MILRIWHGWTTHENADAYEQLLHEEVFIKIEKMKIAGFKKISLLKRLHATEVEFMTMMQFDHINAVKQFAGEQYRAAYVPAAARALLKRFDPESQHYHVLEERVS